MKPTQTIGRSPAWARSGLAIALILAITSLGLRAQETGEPKEFSKPVIDIGVVVRDAEKSGRFYTEAIGETPVSIGTNVRLTTVRDPDGNFIELIGP